MEHLVCFLLGIFMGENFSSCPLDILIQWISMYDSRNLVLFKSMLSQDLCSFLQLSLDL